MLLCPNYKKCKIIPNCPHRKPHMEENRINSCSTLLCSIENVLCIEELYVYMKEAIKK
jgi:hypothetical protein